MLIDPSGKAIIAGRLGGPTSIDAAVARLYADGTADATYRVDGVASLQIGARDSDQAHAVARQSTGKIIVAGAEPVAKKRK